MIALTTLTQPANKKDFTAYFHTDESDFYDAYKAHLQVADALAAAPHHFYWDAMYHLNFSIECFLKYAFCLVRKQHLNVQTFGQLSTWLTPWTTKPPFKKYLHAAGFSHDFKKLKVFFENETNALNFNEFKDLSSQFPADDKWVEDRYKPRIHSNYQLKYTDYRNAFEDALQTPFGSIR